MVGEAMATLPSAGMSMITAMLPLSPASQCSLWDRSVVVGVQTNTLEHRSGAGAFV